MQLETRNGILHIEFESSPTLDELKEAISALRGKKDPLRLWHFKGGLKVSTEEIRQLSDFVSIQDSVPRRIAIVIPDDVGFGSARMYTGYWQDEDAPIAVFRTLPEATRFLLGENNSE